MKKVLLLGLIAASLVGCAAVDKESTAANAEYSNHQQAQVIHFTGPHDLTLQLSSSDQFETATLVDNSSKQYLLKRVVSGSGIRLANDEGVSIHFKNVNGLQEGVVELVKDKSIPIKEFKPH